MRGVYFHVVGGFVQHSCVCYSSSVGRVVVSACLSLVIFVAWFIRAVARSVWFAVVLWCHVCAVFACLRWRTSSVFLPTFVVP